MLNLRPTKDDGILIHAIAVRAASLARKHNNMDFDMLTCDMDITACHLNGCPLDLRKLLEAPDRDFAHDIGGISGTINRTTGKLEHDFDPRCALPSEA